MKASIKYSNRTIARFEQYGPNVTINIGDTLTVASGATVRITCPAVGPPKPSIVWKKRGTCNAVTI